MKFLEPHQKFPSPEMADPIGLLAFGGDLSPERLMEAYSNGIFPWYDASQPILWWSPDPRMVLFPHKLKVSKSMKQLLRKNIFEVTWNCDFANVIEHCAMIDRGEENGTWITAEMRKAYLELHKSGKAISVEVWQDHELVGGLYGVYLREKKIFCGESMFTRVSNASKYGFIKMVEKLKEEGVVLIDCQVYTAHLESLGAEEIPRRDFLKFLQ